MNFKYFMHMKHSNPSKLNFPKQKGISLPYFLAASL